MLLYDLLLLVRGQHWERDLLLACLLVHHYLHEQWLTLVWLLSLIDMRIMLLNLVKFDDYQTVLKLVLHASLLAALLETTIVAARWEIWHCFVHYYLGILLLRKWHWWVRGRLLSSWVIFQSGLVHLLVRLDRALILSLHIVNCIWSTFRVHQDFAVLRILDLLRLLAHRLLGCGLLLQLHLKEVDLVLAIRLHVQILLLFGKNQIF